MRKTSLSQFARIAHHVSRHRKIEWLYDGERAGPMIHGPDGVTPFLLHHGVFLADAASMPSLLPPLRFFPGERSLMGLSVRADAAPGKEGLSPIDVTLGGLMYIQALDDVVNGLKMAAREHPEWGRFIQQEGGDTLVVDARGVSRLSYLAYGRDYALEAVNDRMTRAFGPGGKGLADEEMGLPGHGPEPSDGAGPERRLAF